MLDNSGEELFHSYKQKCRIYVACGVSQTPKNTIRKEERKAMELALKNGFLELSGDEMFISDGEGPVAAVTVEAFTILAGVAVIALTPAKGTGVKILIEGSIAATGLYFV